MSKRTRSQPGEPMDHANMRSLGIRSLAVTCELCHHAAVVDVETVRAGGSTFDVVRKKITEAGRHALAAGSQK